MSKTVITCTNADMDSLFDKRFGRAGAFCILNEDTGQIIFLPNRYKELKESAGLSVVQELLQLNITKIISGDFGSRTADLLFENKVQMVSLDYSCSLSEILDKLIYR